MALSKSESSTPAKTAPPQAEVLLGLIHDLVLELHPHKRGALQVSLTTRLDQDLGFDSLSRIELLTRIEQHFGLGLPEQIGVSADSPQDLLRAMAQARPGGKHDSVLAYHALTLGDAEAAPAKAETLLDMLDWHVANHGDRTHVLFYNENRQIEELTYQGLLTGAESLAAGLVELGLEQGQTVAIMLPSGMDYFFSFMGVLLAGGIPVPIYPPARASQIEDHLRRHANILVNAQTRVLITVDQAKVAARLLKMQVEHLQAIVTPQELSRPGVTTSRPRVRPDHLAHLQYTSGSTGNPKGVILTHANLMANVRAMGGNLNADSTDAFVSWLPLYHDMGLIGAWLGSMYFAIPLVLMSPLTFLAHPEQWLWAIHHHRGSISGGPNFSYELLLRRVKDEQIQGLDLSSWRVAFNGAEPVIPDTLRRFADRFEPYGFRRDAISAVYGLAEASVGLAFPPFGRGLVVDRIQRESFATRGQAIPASPEDPNVLEFVACGHPLPGHEVRVVDDTGQELGEREEGRLQFKGPSVTSGYYRNPQATAGLFAGEWVESGDMAYIWEADIYLTGRRKDIIIRAGRNIYPHELEEAIGNLPGIRKGCVAVFGAKDEHSGTEKLIVLAETREHTPGALQALRAGIEGLALDLLGNPVDDVMLVPPHTVPKTSSGKIRRASSRELYEKGITETRQRAVWLQVVRLTLIGMVPQLRRVRHLLADWLYGLYWLLMLGLVAPATWITVALVPSQNWAWTVTRAVGRFLLRITRTQVTLRGVEHLKPGQSYVVVVNHASYLDGLVLTAQLPGLWSFIAKRELLGNLVTSVFLNRLGTQFVERFDKQKGVEDARRVAHRAVAGHSLVIFPEGTFRRAPGLLPFHMGGFQAAAEAGIPVLPVVLRGTRSILRDGHWLPRRGRVALTLLAPIAPEGKGWAAAVKLRDLARAEMLRWVGEPDMAGQPPKF